MYDDVKIISLLESIKDRKYTNTNISNIEEVPSLIAAELGGISEDEAISILGYFLKNGYVKIIPTEGLVINYDDFRRARAVNLLIQEKSFFMQKDLTLEKVREKFNGLR